MRFILLLFALSLVSHPTTVAQVSGSVTSIEIRSRWGGLGPAGDSSLRINQQKGVFRANGKRIDSKLVESLLRELDASVEIGTLTNLGIDESWLRANADEVLPERLKREPQNEKDLFLDSYRNMRLVEKLLPEILSQGWTDDFPEVLIRINKKDSSEIRLTSSRQNIFMTPFVIEENGRIRASFNANLSRAIAALLPKDFTNRERLEGARLKFLVAEKVVSYLDSDLNLLETKNKLGPELKQLEGRYALRETSIGYRSSVDVETLGEHFPRWNAKLHRNDLPEKITIGISLPFENRRLINFDLFLQRIDSIVSLPLSVPWLSGYLSRPSEEEMEIRFVTDRSMSAKAESYFAETLTALKASPLLAESKPWLPGSTFIEFRSPHGWSRWVVLPNHKMILFDFQGETVLKWRLDDFNTQTRYGTRYWHMAAAVINPQGEIEKK
jgi:hypothetical protein